MTHSFVLVNHDSNVADTSFLAPLMFLCVGASCVFQLEVQKFIVLSWGLRKSSPRFLNCRIAPSWLMRPEPSPPSFVPFFSITSSFDRMKLWPFSATNRETPRLSKRLTSTVMVNCCCKTASVSGPASTAGAASEVCPWPSASWCLRRNRALISGRRLQHLLSQPWSFQPWLSRTCPRTPFQSLQTSASHWGARGHIHFSWWHWSKSGVPSQAAHPKNEALLSGWCPHKLPMPLPLISKYCLIFLREDSLTSAESTISLGHFEARNASGLFWDQSGPLIWRDWFRASPSAMVALCPRSFASLHAFDLSAHRQQPASKKNWYGRPTWSLHWSLLSCRLDLPSLTQLHVGSQKSRQLLTPRFAQIKRWRLASMDKPLANFLYLWRCAGSEWKSLVVNLNSIAFILS